MTEQQPQRWGGKVEPGKQVFAEQTGCMLFIPKSANPIRTAAILRKAMEWYGRAPRTQDL